MSKKLQIQKRLNPATLSSSDPFTKQVYEAGYREGFQDARAIYSIEGYLTSVMTRLTYLISNLDLVVRLLPSDKQLLDALNIAEQLATIEDANEEMLEAWKLFQDLGRRAYNYEIASFEDLNARFNRLITERLAALEALSDGDTKPIRNMSLFNTDETYREINKSGRRQGKRSESTLWLKTRWLEIESEYPDWTPKKVRSHLLGEISIWNGSEYVAKEGITDPQRKALESLLTNTARKKPSEYRKNLLEQTTD